jgi:hypothetical protein
VRLVLPFAVPSLTQALLRRSIAHHRGLRVRLPVAPTAEGVITGSTRQDRGGFSIAIGNGLRQRGYQRR